jgi:hypothetical protein
MCPRIESQWITSALLGIILASGIVALPAGRAAASWSPRLR